MAVETIETCIVMSSSIILNPISQTRTVSLSSRRIFIFEAEDVVVPSPDDTILEMYPETAETTSMFSELV